MTNRIVSAFLVSILLWSSHVLAAPNLLGRACDVLLSRINGRIEYAYPELLAQSDEEFLKDAGDQFAPALGLNPDRFFKSWDRANRFPRRIVKRVRPTFFSTFRLGDARDPRSLRARFPVDLLEANAKYSDAYVSRWADRTVTYDVFRRGQNERVGVLMVWTEPVDWMDGGVLIRKRLFLARPSGLLKPIGDSVERDLLNWPGLVAPI